ncbi:MAG TPA: ABC transporter permease, partial [Actinomycetota bacterium]|nr:ABC transporter permease [Actinomycetota bacterium]
MSDPIHPAPDTPATDTAAPERTEEPASHEVEATTSLAGAIVTTGRGGWRQAILVPILAIVTALAVGAILIIFTNPDCLHAWERFFRHPVAALNISGLVVRRSYYALFSGAFGSPSDIARAIGSGHLSEIQAALRPLTETVVSATPLIFAGLSVAIGFRAGLFNIGAEGQITVGAIAASIVGFSLPGLPGPIHLALVVGAGFLGGAIWGFIPGVLKVKTGAHEVITTIMLNFVAANLALWALSTDFMRPVGRTDPISKPIDVAFPHLLGGSLRLHAGVLVALGVAVGAAWLLNRTTIGFEVRAVGANPDAARAAGMSPGRTIVMVMALAGGMAGLASANQLASVSPTLAPGFSSGYGFDAIALALLGRARPIGVVAAS